MKDVVLSVLMFAIVIAILSAVTWVPMVWR